MGRRIAIRLAVAVVVAAGLGALGWSQRHRWTSPSDEPAAAARPAVPIEVTSVKLSEEAVRGLGLVAAPAKLEPYTRVIDVPGVVIDAPGNDRAVTAPA